MTFAQTAELYGVAEHTIPAWLNRGDPRLPEPIRFGRNFVRFRRGDVLARIDAIGSGRVVPLRSTDGGNAPSHA